MRRICVALVLALVFSLLFSCAPAEEPPIGGDLPSRDEVPPKETPATPTREPEGFFIRTDVTVEALRYVDGAAAFEGKLLNHSGEEKMLSLRYYVQKRVEGSWQFLPFENSNDYKQSLRLETGYQTLRLPITALTDLPGEFRLLLGIEGSIRVEKDASGKDQLAFEQGAELIVGTVTVTESPRLGEITVRDGLPQNSLVTVEIEGSYTVNSDKLRYTLNNQSAYPIQSFKADYIQYNQNGEWVQPTPFSIREILEIHTGEGIGSYDLTAHKFGMPVGDYRLVCETKHGFYAVGYFSLSADTVPANDRFPDELRPSSDLPKGELIELDGVEQNSLITATMMGIDLSMMELELRLENQSSVYVYYLLEWSLQIKQGDEWVEVLRSEWWAYEDMQPFSRFYICLPTDFTFESGEYRFVADTGYGFNAVCYFAFPME